MISLKITKKETAYFYFILKNNKKYLLVYLFLTSYAYIWKEKKTQKLMC